MIRLSRARAAMISSVCADNFGRVIGQGNHSSVPTRERGVGIGGTGNNSVDDLT